MANQVEILQNELPKNKAHFKVKPVAFFSVLDVLRKDKDHYLWKKSIKSWNEIDWIKFTILKES